MSKVELRVPTIGESVTEVTLSQWLKEDGAYVEMDEAICEFESDKATLEFPSEDSGELKHVAEEGQDLEIGDLVAELDTDAEADSGEEEAGEVEEKKFSEDESAEEKGKEASGEQSSEEDATDDETKQEEAKTDEQDKGEEKEEHYAKGHAAPAAGKLMREHNLEASDIDGTGKNGRILKEDVQGVIEDRESAEESREKKKEGQQSVEEDSSESAPGRETLSRETSRERMSRMRRTIASHLVSAKNDTAMLTTFNEADMSEVIALRKKYQEEFVEKFDIKLGFMSIFAKACAQILLRMPDVNAFKDGDELVYHDYADISIAISTDNGLVVPPVHNVESLHFAEIEKKIKILAEKAREGTLSLEEMQGGTFTITNGGIFGSLVSTPILNAPQSAILGMHAIQERPVAIDGEVEVRPMMYLALSYDHQVIDGKTAVTFLVEVKKLLEDPMKLFLDL